MAYRVPQYLHKPLQVLWFDTHDILILLFGGFIAQVLQSYLGLVILGLCVVLMRIKGSKPRGWVLHSIYRVGLARLKGYPLPTARTFHE